MRYVVALVVWVAAVAGAGALSSVVAGSIHNAPRAAQASVTSTNGTTATSPSPTPAAPFDPSTVTATDADSLFKTANLTKAIGLISARYGSSVKVDNFALYPGYLALIIESHGGSVNLIVNAHDSLDVVNTGPSIADQTTFPLSKVKVDAPEILAGRITSATKLPEAKLGYMVAQYDPDTGFAWLIYPKSGTNAQYFRAKGPHAPLVAFTGTGYVRVH